MIQCIKYKKGYKYQLQENTSIQTEVLPVKPVATTYIGLDLTGMLIVKVGYAWDGATDTMNPTSGLRGSLYHDALYQLMRLEYVDMDKYRAIADKLLYTCCLEDGMNSLRAEAWYEAVRTFAHRAALPDEEPEILFAPEGCGK